MGTKPRRQFSAQFKLAAVLELLAGHKSAAQICRERQITDNLLYRWKQTFVAHAPSVFGPPARARARPRRGSPTWSASLVNSRWRTRF